QFSTLFLNCSGVPFVLLTLILFILICIVFFIFNTVSFIFHPSIVIVSMVAPPAMIAFIVYYLTNPLVNVLEKLRIKRLWRIIIIILGILGAIAGLAFLVIPSIEKQINAFSVEIPNYAQQFGDKIQFLVKNSFLE